MRQFNKFRDTKGFIQTWAWAVRFRDMIQEAAKERARILTFWEKHGDEATREAFQVSRATLFRWQKALWEGGGKLEALNKRSTVPARKRTKDRP